jgi:hypothetical protein
MQIVIMLLRHTAATWMPSRGLSLACPTASPLSGSQPQPVAAAALVPLLQQLLLLGQAGQSGTAAT